MIFRWLRRVFVGIPRRSEQFVSDQMPSVSPNRNSQAHDEFELAFSEPDDQKMNPNFSMAITTESISKELEGEPVLELQRKELIQMLSRPHSWQERQQAVLKAIKSGLSFNDIEAVLDWFDQ